MSSSRLFRSIVLPLSLVLVAACGDSGPSSNAVTAQDAESYCADTCEHVATCEETSVAECTASCVADVQGWMREDVLAELTECVIGLSCEVPRETCFATCTPTDAHERYETACRASAMTCGASGAAVEEQCEASFTNDNDVGFVCLIAPQIVDRLTACFDLGCDQVDRCIYEVYQDAGVAD